ncbi:MAG: peptidase S41 [Novosphingobium sp. 16-62-11]|nr:MAG: peptidase S41 [Novosphingobium sp. 16-62-11]
MVTALSRSSLWLVSLLIAVVACAAAVDTGFAIHMFIVALACIIGLIVTLRGVDLSKAILAPDQGRYDDDPIRWGVITTVFWGMAGFLAGLFIALQLALPVLNLGFEWTAFGRVRPLHTSAVIFAFGGNALIATSFYVVQRTCRARLAFPGLARFVFWGYQLFIVLAATGYLLGITQGKEYAEPEWYVDLWLTIVWVAYLAVFVGTIVKRTEPHIYVANWFYLSFIITVAMLHIVNNLNWPVSFVGSRSYPIFAGVQGALVQWWYGHNAVGFFLTAGFLAMMYYFVPKQAERPIFSYRLSIIHFWALIFLYIWAGPHHLHYTALPDWAQTLGMVFSVMLWMPSWGGMINGLMTLNGACTFASIYYLVPRLWNQPRLYSLRMVNWHFWLATVGIVFYAASMWVAGITQGLMWREYGADGYLVNSFVETVAALKPMFFLRAFGGLLYLAGAVVMTVNVWRTILGHQRAEAPMSDAPYDPEKDRPVVAAAPAAA